MPSTPEQIKIRITHIEEEHSKQFSDAREGFWIPLFE